MAAPNGYLDSDAFDDAVDDAARAAGARRVVFGRSVEGRELVAVTTGAGSGPNVAIVAGIHGVEVVSTQLALRLLHDLANPSATTRSVLEQATITVAPCLNPDGRAASIESLGRRRLFNPAPRRNANGVDLNRNWPWPAGVVDHWLPISGTRTKRLPWCRGPHALSEPETAAFAELLDQLRPVALLNLHSTGRILTFPWSSKPEAPDDLDAFVAMATAFRAAQPSVRYRYKQSRAWYPIVGSSNDYVYDRYGTLAMTVETSEEARAVRDDWRLARWAFWYANPVDVDHHLDNDAPGCWAALAVALERHRVPAQHRSPV